jgi:thioredoxin-related protein
MSFWLASGCLLAEIEVPVATDLQQLGVQASEHRLPILLTFSAIECSYCDLLEEEFLEPMLLGDEYTDKIIIRKLVLDNGSRIGDFSGRQIDATQLSDRYRIYVTPTILFVDASGRELAERMVGINTPEMFGGYLDNCIETALLGIRAPERLAQLHGCQLQAQ